MHKNGNYKPEELLQVKEYNDLINATKEVFDTAITHQIGDSMRSYLEQDSFIFSALKTHTQITEASSYLLDQNGNVQPYHLFEQKVNKLNQQYNNNYLKAEYHFAVGAGQSIERWESFSDDEDRYWLQYRTANDDKVRDSHAILHNTTLPKSDPFWDSYTVPNGWSCRCSTVEVLARKHQKSNSEKAIRKGEAATTQINKNGKNTLAMFRFNPAKQKKLFPPNNSYNQVTRAKNVKKLIEEKAEKRYAPYEPKTIKIYKNGGKIISSNLVDVKANDYERVYQCCDHFAEKGYVAEIMPSFSSPLKSETYKQLYKGLKDTKYYGKCPDIQIDGKFYEHEGFVGDITTMTFKTAFKKATNMIGRGVKQSDKIIIDYTPCEYKSIVKIIKERIKNGLEINEVWVLKNGSLEQIY